MNKCNNCGTEFEGQTCPECGMAAEHTMLCPTCGNKLDGNVKFCNHCGQKILEQQPAQTGQSDYSGNAQATITLNWRKVKEILPIIIYSLWAVLLWAVFSARVIKGDGILIENVNVYQLLNNDLVSDEMRIMAKALIACAAAANIFIPVAIILYIKGDEARRGIAILGFFFIVPVTLVAVLIKIRCNYATAGLEYMRGSMPVLFLVFTGVISILLAVFSFKSNTQLAEELIYCYKRRKRTYSADKIIKECRRDVRGALSCCFLSILILCWLLFFDFAEEFNFNKFSERNLQKINLGDTSQEVESILGAPYEKTPESMVYYSRNYINKKEAIAKAVKSDTAFLEWDKAQAYVKKQEKELEQLDYKRITVFLEDDKVVGLEFEEHAGSGQEENPEQIRLSKLDSKNLEFTCIVADGRLEPHGDVLIHRVWLSGAES